VVYHILENAWIVNNQSIRMVELGVKVVLIRKVGKLGDVFLGNWKQRVGIKKN
jgi:hypothetical protein